jgi:hypothetical protein
MSNDCDPTFEECNGEDTAYAEDDYGSTTGGASSWPTLPHTKIIGAGMVAAGGLMYFGALIVNLMGQSEVKKYSGAASETYLKSLAFPMWVNIILGLSLTGLGVLGLFESWAGTLLALSILGAAVRYVTTWLSIAAYAAYSISDFFSTGSTQTLSFVPSREWYLTYYAGGLSVIGGIVGLFNWSFPTSKNEAPADSEEYSEERLIRAQL